MGSFFKAFRYAAEGVFHGLTTERNFKFHLVAAIIVVSAGFLTDLTRMEWVVIILLIAGMLALELMNSAVERIVDLVTSERHPLAKQAKDLAAGAVLIYAMSSVIIGLIIFLPKWLM